VRVVKRNLVVQEKLKFGKNVNYVLVLLQNIPFRFYVSCINVETLVYINFNVTKFDSFPNELFTSRLWL